MEKIIKYAHWGVKCTVFLKNVYGIGQGKDQRGAVLLHCRVGSPGVSGRSKEDQFRRDAKVESKGGRLREGALWCAGACPSQDN